MLKSYTIKVYSIASAFLKAFAPNQIKNDISFSSTINGGQGSCVIDISLPFDNFDEGVSIAQENIVKVYEQDDTNNLTPVLIYAGFISQYEPYFNEGDQGVRITLLGLASLLNLSYYKNGSSFNVTETAKDPAQIMKDVLDHFNSVYSGSLIGYSGGHAATVGTSVTYAFIDTKWMDAIKKAFELSGSGRWWRIGADGELYFQAKASTATWRFVIEKNLSQGDVTKNSERITNAIELRYGPGATVLAVTDATSIAAYGRREVIETDTSITDGTTATQHANQVINNNKDPKVQAKFRVNSTFNIESIKPGDTCSVFNFKSGSTTFPTNMLITAVRYTPDFVELDLENTSPTFLQTFAAAVANA